MATVLVTGGCGYIGSHTVLELLQEEDVVDVIVVDNLVNSSKESLKRVEELTGKSITFYQQDICDLPGLINIFKQHPSIQCVLHFAGYKCVGESVKKPLLYYHNNVLGSLTLVQAMEASKVYNLVFSSSCTVYGDPQYLPVDEVHPTGICTNPYGRSKYMVEQIFRATARAQPRFNIICLRYFNPVGAHPSGLLGEDPEGIPNNLMPNIAHVAVGKKTEVQVFGDDYPTKDGTCVRDFLHVVELAQGHVKAIQKLKDHCGFLVYNLGTGEGYSVLEMIQTFTSVSGMLVPYRVVERRAGDVPVIFADPSLALTDLGWKAERSIKEMCEDTWRWQSNNPRGYRGIQEHKSSRDRNGKQAVKDILTGRQSPKFIN